MDEKLLVHAVDSDYGLASLDIDCLESILHLKLANVPFKLSPLTTVKTCVFYTVPTLKTDTRCVTSYKDIVLYLKDFHKVDLDASLSAKQRSASMAIETMVKSSLGPALEFMQWIDDANSDKMVRWFVKALPFPFGKAYTRRKQKGAEKLIEVLYPNDELTTDKDLIKGFLCTTAATCFQALSNRLGKSWYFHGGDTPTAIDVIVYAHLAFFVKFPFPTNDLNMMLLLWPNLVEFVKRIDAKYLSEFAGGVKYLKEEERVKSDDDVSYMGLFIIFATATLCSLNFALKKGLINPSTLKL